LVTGALKPSNVKADAATDLPRVMDFGLAKQLDVKSSQVRIEAARLEMILTPQPVYVRLPKNVSLLPLPGP
jgi:hypothetical protein